MGSLDGVTVHGVSAVRTVPGLTAEQVDAVLSDNALAFVAGLHRTFAGRRAELLAARAARRAAIAAGATLDFLPQTADIRAGNWRVASPAPGLVDRRAEITGPTDAKMLINALNSGARVFMADLEDANVPTWSNMVVGQHNLSEAVAGTLAFTSPDGRRYELDESTATLVVRPRGWHLPERHVTVDGEPIVAALFDAGMYLVRNAHALRATGVAPYFYLPKLESHLEARLWNDVFTAAQAELGLPVGTIRATVLIETLPAAFEMEEILYELREHSAGLNAGRWDYMFSTIKTFASRPTEFLLPDRNGVTMTVPFLRAYTELLVSTCHRRGAHAIGGMAAFIPSRRDPEINAAALAKVRADKERESADGFDGSWVAHPDLVPVCTEVFDAVLGDEPNQLTRLRDDVKVGAGDLLAVRDTPGSVTAAGVRGNISVGVRYLESWLRGIGAVGIDNLMEDAATAEISRSQIFQWIAAGVVLDDGRPVTADLVRTALAEVLDQIRLSIGAAAFDNGRWKDAAAVFEETALGETFVEFLTLPAYERID
ncbi:malate synthase [Frankia casuarinae]|uniref:Malate synthase n=1 Tax=Frankia casuarinae (strain DSM 45818 / CECT 9043 / HFP020203 / CcI3) TaxID=106370 RepID=Q2JDN6_FRACC|nr:MULTISPECIES: malate synthase A [Frankia]ABD10606.1 Malate synthase A [Frankia casuarinae]ETA02869.1 malate synthase [Frankia sp. CcI6]EYT93360.1 malate synthase [Frankia casuarinae]KEZ36842.1 malate synthase [Frankia sp. CeD]KFB06158.1 malate synthase [Frankia sp. Allo2]